MQLKRLGMYGFKSFAKKVEIEFGNGITGIVGPNGSGKSNISDAIRWVLGEQNIRNVRGNQLIDVIFKGSKELRASGVAEVTLLFDNDGDIPVDFKEILIQRRIFRTGESEFYINRSRCRLKDISDLFADTGIGLGGISIISQNRVDDVLKSKPEDRRIFFEETIGITKYRNRKRETLHRIEDTESNLVRVADILSELESQLKPLQIQAERTNNYNKLEAERRHLQLIELHRKHNKLSTELDNQKQSHQKFSDSLIELQTKLNSEETIKEQLSKEVIDIEQKLQAQSEQKESIRKKLETTSNNISRLTERQSQGKNSHEQVKRNQQKLSNSIKASNDDLTSLKDTLSKQREELAIQNRLLKSSQSEANELEAQIQTQANHRREAERTISKLQQNLSKAQNEILIVEHDLKSFTSNQQSFKENESALHTELDALRVELETLQSKKQSNDEEVSKLKQQQNDLTSALKAESQANKNLQVEQNKQSQSLHAVESRLQILKRMQQNYEGFAKAPKAVLMSKAPWRSKVYGAVGELLSVPAKFTTAIEIALGSNVQNIVTEDEETAKAAIEYLKKSKLGRVTFLPLSRISSYAKLRTVDDEGAIGFANELVQIDKNLTKIADFLLSRTLIVDNINNALKISRRHNIRIVTLEGEVLNLGGSISGGSSRQAESNIFSRAGEIESLTNELKSINDSLNDLEIQREILNLKLQSINEDLERINKRLNELNVEAAENRMSINQSQRSFDEKQQKLTDLNVSMTQQNDSIEELHQRMQMYLESIEEFNKNLNSEQVNLDKISMELSQKESDHKNLSKNLKKLEIDCAVQEQQIIRTENQLELLQNKISNDEAELKNLRAEEKTLLKNLSNSAVELSRLSKENELTKTLLAYNQEQIKVIYSQKLEKQTNISEAEKTLRDLNHQISSLKNKVHDIELAMSQLKILIQDCEEKINDEAMMNDDKFVVDDSLNEVEIADRIKDIEIKLQEIGAVNPNAPQEFDELKNRYDFLNQQLEDLQTAKNNLQTLINEMDNKIVAQFLAAFQKIQVYFAEIFVKLFGGGEAKLELTDKEDVLNTGVEIMVTLPNKKRQPLSVLSGGERALTVIALLFSFLRFKPSPFCILDEVDAPLDEANLLRFGSFLKEFSANTQFILITHRKTMMEFLDTIYGITIEEAGISKILSVKLNGAIN